MTDACAPAGKSWIHAVRRAGLAALAVVLLAAIGAMAVRSHGSAAPAQRASAAPARLPLAARAPVSRALGRDDASYWAQRSAGGLQVVNRAQRLRAQFGRGSVLVSSGGVSLGLRLRAYGYGAALQPLSAVAARVAANQVVYVHAGVSEWYANGPLGLEQGFTVPAASAGRHAGPLTLELGLSGDARGRLLRGADGVMFTGAGGALAYQGLEATDARGRALPAWIELRGRELSDQGRPVRAAGQADCLRRGRVRRTRHVGGDLGRHDRGRRAERDCRLQPRPGRRVRVRQAPLRMGRRHPDREADRFRRCRQRQLRLVGGDLGRHGRGRRA